MSPPITPLVTNPEVTPQPVTNLGVTPRFEVEAGVASQYNGPVYETESSYHGGYVAAGPSWTFNNMGPLSLTARGGVVHEWTARADTGSTPVDLTNFPDNLNYVFGPGVYVGLGTSTNLGPIEFAVGGVFSERFRAGNDLEEGTFGAVHEVGPTITIGTDVGETNVALTASVMDVNGYDGPEGIKGRIGLRFQRTLKNQPPAPIPAVEREEPISPADSAPLPPVPVDPLAEEKSAVEEMAAQEFTEGYALNFGIGHPSVADYNCLQAKGHSMTVDQILNLAGLTDKDAAHTYLLNLSFVSNEKRLEIRGWASPDGDEGVNIRLANRRAYFVQALLKAMAVEDTDISIQAYGITTQEVTPEAGRCATIRIVDKEILPTV